MIKFIESKLRPPDLKPNLIKRERLIERLRLNLDLNASFICAGPGWGKTTVAADFLAATDRRALWYSLDSSDADIVLFFQYLVRAVRQISPDFGQGTLNMLPSGASTRPEQLADLFLYELAEAVVVIDQRGSGTYADNVEFVVGDAARLTVVSIADWNDDAVHVSTHHATLGKDAVLRHVAVTLGGDLVRLTGRVRFCAPGGDAELLGGCGALGF